MSTEPESAENRGQATATVHPRKVSIAPPPDTSTLLRYLAKGGATLPAKLREQRHFIRVLRRSLNDSQLLESVQKVRDSVLRRTLAEGSLDTGRVVALSGIQGREGASWVSLMLTLSLGACVHRRIAYIDGRFNVNRFEAISRVFGLSRNEFSVNKGATEMWGCHNRAQPNTHFLESGSIEDSLEFFSDRQLVPFLDELRRNFDYVIIDMPPMLQASSNIFLAPLVDQFYLIACAGKTRLADIDTCMELAEQEGSELSGVIVNKQALPFCARLFWKKYFF